MKKKPYRIAALVGLASIVAAGLAACASRPPAPMATVDKVDLAAFMGEWHVIGSIPTWFERGAYNATDHYALAADGTIDIRFTYNQGAADGPAKQMDSRGFVLDASNAVWGVQFVWPIKADYRIAWLSPDGRQTIIAREKRDYVWIMARDTTMTEADYQSALRRVAALGYDVSKVEKAPR